MRDFRILISLEKAQFINFVKSILGDKKRLIFYALYGAFMVWIVSVNVTNSSQSTLKEMLNFKTYFSAGAILMLTLMTYGMLKKSSLYFKMADVNLVFTAPLDNRTVLMMTLLKRIPTYLLTSVFTLIFILSLVIKMFEPTGLALLMTALGYTLLLLILEPLSFCIFVLSTKFHIDGFREKTLKIMFWSLGILIMGSAFLAGLDKGFTPLNMMEGIASPILNYLPLIGWTRFLVMTAIDGVTVMSFVVFGGMVVLYVSIVVLTYLLADDYYEDVMALSEERAHLIQEAKQGRVKLNGIQFKKKSVQVRDNCKFADAIHWKRQLMLKRTDFSVYVSMETLLCILIMIGIHLFDMGGAAEYGPFMASGMYFYIKFLFSMQSQLDHELKKPFFYLIPDSPMKKILATVKIDLIRFLINVFALVTTHMVIQQAFDVVYVLLPFAMMLFYAMMLFSSYLFNIFLPSGDFQRLAIMFKMLQTLIILLPSLIVLITIGVVTESPVFALAGSMMINGLLCVVILALADVLFDRLELK